jgi:hypothetical protein
VQLAGISDSNIAAAALSPDRVSGTAVTQSRTISTTSPITGGGDFSANRTIACPACVTSVSGTANEILSTGGATPTLSLPSTVDLSGKTMKGGTPLVLDGATTDANKTTVVVTDPTAARSFTLPNADSVAVQPATCSGTDKVSAINSSGAITCSTDQSGSGTHNLLSSTHPDTVATSPILGDLLYGNATPAWDKIAGNITTTKKYLSQTGTSTASAAPVWSQPSFSELSGSATAGQVPNLENQNGMLTPAKGGTGANNTAISGRYLRGDGTNFVSSSVAAAGAGSCTNQFVRATVDNAAPTCSTVGKADATSTFVHADQSNTYSGSTTQDFSSIVAVKLPSSAGPAPTTGGDIRYDTTRAATVAGGDQSTSGFIPRVLKITNCTTEGNCASASGGNQVSAASGAQGTTETNFASNWSMPANFLFSNKAVQVCAVFELTTSATAPTLTVRFKAGSTVLAANPATAPINSASTRGASYCYLLVGTAAAGASVSVEAGFVGGMVHTAALMNNIDQPVAGIATNGALTLQISAQWGTATNGNTVQLHQFYVMELY